MQYDELLNTVTTAAVGALSQRVVKADGAVVYGFFDENWVSPSLSGIDSAIIEPAVRLTNADAQNMQEGETLTINNRIYKIMRIIRGESPGLMRVVLK